MLQKYLNLLRLNGGAFPASQWHCYDALPSNVAGHLHLDSIIAGPVIRKTQWLRTASEHVA